MTWLARLDDALTAFRGYEDGPPPDNVTRLSRTKTQKKSLTGEDIDSFMEAADNREPAIFLEMEALLKELAPRNPVKTAQIRRDIRWVRHEAYKVGLKWGRKKKGLW